MPPAYLPRAAQPSYALPPPPPRRGAHPLLIGCFVFLGVMAGIAFAMYLLGQYAIKRGEQQEAAAAAQKTNRLLENKDWSNPDQVTSLCAEAEAAKIPPDIRTRCAEAHLAVAKRHVEEKRFGDAQKSIDTAASFGVSATARGAMETSLKNAEAAAAAAARLAYAQQLRERDPDIKVKLSGQHNERITLTSSRLNDEWAKQPATRSLLGEMKKQGFTRVDVKGGRKYQTSFDLQ